jgi:hypothetical protein
LQKKNAREQKIVQNPMIKMKDEAKELFDELPLPVLFQSSEPCIPVRALATILFEAVEVTC